RKALRMERADDAELAIDRMRGWEQLARRLAPQDVAARGRLEKIGRIGLPALELAHAQRRREIRQAKGEKGFEPRGIERERASDFFGAGKCGLAIDRRHGDWSDAWSGLGAQVWFIANHEQAVMPVKVRLAPASAVLGSRRLPPLERLRIEAGTGRPRLRRESTHSVHRPDRNPAVQRPPGPSVMC